MMRGFKGGMGVGVKFFGVVGGWRVLGIFLGFGILGWVLRGVRLGELGLITCERIDNKIMFWFGGSFRNIVSGGFT
jgi:hypothetical protein